MAKLEQIYEDLAKQTGMSVDDVRRCVHDGIAKLSAGANFDLGGAEFSLSKRKGNTWNLTNENGKTRRKRDHGGFGANFTILCSEYEGPDMDAAKQAARTVAQKLGITEIKSAVMNAILTPDYLRLFMRKKMSLTVTY